MIFNRKGYPDGFEINEFDWIIGKSITGHDVSGYIIKIYPGEPMYGLETVVKIVTPDLKEVDCHLYEIELDVKKMRELKLKDILDEKR